MKGGELLLFPPLGRRRDLDFTRRFLIDYYGRMFFGRDDFHFDLYDLLVVLNLLAALFARILGGNALGLVPGYDWPS